MLGLLGVVLSAMDLNHRLFEVEHAFFLATILLDRLHVDSEDLLDRRRAGIHA